MERAIRIPANIRKVMAVPTAGIVTNVGTKVPIILPTVLKAPKVPIIFPLSSRESVVYFARLGVTVPSKNSGKTNTTMQAAKAAITSPLLETTIDGAKGVIINITAAPDIDLEDVYAASNIVKETASDDANVIFGVAFNEELDDEMIVTVVATGFGGPEDKKKNRDANFPSFDEDTDISSSSTGIKDEDIIDVMHIFDRN
jgi:cell division protein FtsZ